MAVVGEGKLLLSDAHQRISAAVTDTLSGWTESRWPYDLFPDPEGRSIVHRGFAVGVIRTDAQSDQRQTLARGAYVRTLFGVRWAWRLRADAQVSDYRAALDAEQSLIAALMTYARDPALAVRLAGIPVRQVVGDGTLFLGEVQLSALHWLSLD